MSNQTCPLEGNSDLYGLGIRIGIYIQMITVQLSGLSSAAVKTEDSLGQATIIFVLATGIVLVRLLVNADIEPVEVFPILTLLLAQVGVCRVPYWRGQTTALVYAIEVAGLMALFAWFWWHGMDTLPRSCPDDKAFFFARVSIWHWFRTLNKVGSVFTAMAGAMAVLFYLGALAVFTGIRAVKWYDKFRGADGRFNGKEQNSTGFGIGTTDFVVNIGAIVYVELALRWNNISDVHALDSPGQFMPFFIALAQLLSVFYDLAKVAVAMDSEDEGGDEPGEEDEHEDLPCPHHGTGLPLAHGRP